MKLIDVDNFKKNNPEYLKLDIDYVTEVTVEDVLDCEPTVKAIPINWIKKYYTDITSPYTDIRIQFEEMIRKWERENETD